MMPDTRRDHWTGETDRRLPASHPLSLSTGSVHSAASSTPASDDAFIRQGSSGASRRSSVNTQTANREYENGSAEAFEEGEENRVIYEDFTTIDWMKDLMRDHRRQNRVRARHRPGWDWYLYTLFDATQSWILVSIIGISIGLLAGWIDVIAAWLGDIRFGFCRLEWHVSKSICCTGQFDKDGSCDDWWDWSYVVFGWRNLAFVNWFFYVGLSVAFATACAFVVIHLAPYAAGSGSAEVKTILGGFIIKGFLGIRTLIVKAAGLPLMVASGLAVGKEGPMIHVACCVANVFPRMFPKYWQNEARKREILSAASGAGIAVAFGAPIGGVLFSLEELSSFFPAKTMVRSFFCALVATVTLQLVDPYRGKRVLYQVTYSRRWHFFEMIFFILLGVFGGLLGVLLIRAIRRMQAFRKSSWLKQNPLREVASIAAVTAVLCYFNIYTRVDSSDLLEGLFRECEEADFHGLCDRAGRGRVVALLITALLMRTVLTIVTFGVKVPAGIFIPSMICGALFGRILGIIVQSWQKANPSNPLFYSCEPDVACVTPGVYALLGAIGALGGVTRMTISLTVVMFELTGTLNYIVPCMVTLMTAKVVGDLFGKGGIAEMQIRMNKYPFLDPRQDQVIGLTASEVMTPAEELVCFVGKGLKVEDVERALEQVKYKGFPIVHSVDDPTLVGYLSREDLKYALDKAKSQHTISPKAPVFFDDTDSLASRPPWQRAHSGFTVAESIVSPVLVRGSSTRSLDGQDGDRWLHLTGYIDRTPLQVHPKVSVELVMDLFKKLGLRYILVVHMGRLKGIITKKDILIAMYGEDENGGDSTASIPIADRDDSGRSTPTRRGGTAGQFTRARRLRRASGGPFGSQEWAGGGASGETLPLVGVGSGTDRGDPGQDIIE
ncbi:uncharacterized protein SPPG_01343 [Spizellomyces punctatus DAOM BR117]|uniref:Chloride channel protein n=1 Tax=Spizellomyces punctatus (strain DAOM BR117) TaxID=645134 RepID=A0A0L0HSN4_SPIPD|nr:uncharacterized protein SPPG_01343 [Spizellomyces punctatus DAOM BR117]KND03889.1 hypothetical protein SPPG_01343 [Spizellomyces punctatus DAOM BR117]|eukprot:XP_016611928.1 hypothetical protein SPPG_01343 [Spizellomyces punctatus DAOM BR117]